MDDEKMDWYARQLDSAKRNPARLGLAPIAWEYSLDRPKKYRLHELLSTARNFARILGVPANTDIRLANDTEVGTACAGFYDAPDSFHRPFILIDEALITKQVDESDAIGILVGLTLHESLHVLHTRKGFIRAASSSLDHRQRLLENLIEDFRIEEYLDDTPNYANYLYKTRQVLLVDGWIKRAVEDWDKLVDSQKVLVMVAAFIRCPTTIDSIPSLRDFTDLQNRNVLQVLRTRLPRPPESEDDVARQATLLLDLFDNDYWNRSFRHIAQRGNATPDEIDRLRAQFDADNDSEHSGDEFAGSWQSLIRAQLADATVRSGYSLRMVEAVTELDPAVVRKPNQSPALHGNRNRLPNQHLPGYVARARLIPVKASEAGREKYNEARVRIRQDIARLKSAFPAPQNESKVKSGFSTGKLDSRCLYKAAFNDRIFSQKASTGKRSTASIVLLLDASGSMAYSQRHTRALETAVLLNEVFSEQTDFEARVFSHTTSEDSRYCQLLDHGTVGLDAADLIGSYSPQQGNYDHEAIWGAINIVDGSSNRPARKILLAISDGLPCSKDGVPGSGVACTKQAVADVRRLGWRVIGIGVDSNFGREIYSDRWFIESSSSQLPRDLAKLLVRCLK